METEKMKINLHMVDKIYPVTIERSEEAKYRKAAREVNDCAIRYMSKFEKEKSDVNREDLLAMVAFDISLKYEELKGETEKG